MQDLHRFDNDHTGGPGVDGQQDNRARIYNAALIVTLCVFMASFAPRELFAAAIGALLHAAALASSLAAALRQEPLFPPHLTSWDAAAIFWVLGIFAGWFVDPGVVASFAEPATSAGAESMPPR